MSFIFKNLDQETRKRMVEEVDYDSTHNQLYLSKRFNDIGIASYKHLLADALNNGNEETLAASLRQNQCFKDKEERRTTKGVSMVTVPATAPDTLAEGEFNRFYIRALCLIAIESGIELTVYRARASVNPRAESQALIGMTVDPASLLADLRQNVGIDTALGLPQGPNSGLSVSL